MLTHDELSKIYRLLQQQQLSIILKVYFVRLIFVDLYFGKVLQAELEKPRRLLLYYRNQP